MHDIRNIFRGVYIGWIYIHVYVDACMHVSKNTSETEMQEKLQVVAAGMNLYKPRPYTSFATFAAFSRLSPPFHSDLFSLVFPAFLPSHSLSELSLSL